MKRKKYGFTLIEILITIALIGILVVPTSMSISSIIHYNSSSKSKVNNGALAQKVMEYYRNYDFSKEPFYTNITTVTSPQYYYLAFYNDPTSDTLTNYLQNTYTKAKPIGLSSNENYTQVLTNVGSYPQVPPVTTYNHVIKIVFSNNNGMLKIDTTVWDTTNKDAGKVEYVLLRRYKLS